MHQIRCECGATMPVSLADAGRTLTCSDCQRPSPSRRCPSYKATREFWSILRRAGSTRRVEIGLPCEAARWPLRGHQLLRSLNVILALLVASGLTGAWDFPEGRVAGVLTMEALILLCFGMRLAVPMRSGWNIVEATQLALMVVFSPMLLLIVFVFSSAGWRRGWGA